MVRKVFIGISIILGLLLLLAAGGYYMFRPDEKVLRFIKKNPDRAAIKLVRNDTVLAERNPYKMMPLASTVKIIVAIEYAAQAARGQIDSDERVSLAELEKFYVPNTDGGAHPAWLESVADKIQDHQITIREIAKGMISYSSNANTEWLCEKLGLDNINARLDSLDVKRHTKIHYLVSALFVGKEKFPHLHGKALETALRAMPEEAYIQATVEIHAKLKQDTSYKKKVGDLSLRIQKVWSDRLPRSTVAEYVGIMRKINSRTYFDAHTQHYLDDVMEYPLKNPANQRWLAHAGMKGGSTAFVLTKALYATDKKGNKTELAYFINDLSFLENLYLQMSMNQFELKILTSPSFREKVRKSLME